MQLNRIDWNKGAASAMISIFIIILGLIMYLACFDNLMTYNMSARLQTMTDTVTNSVAAYTVTISEQDANTTSGQSGVQGDQRTNYFNYNSGKDFAKAYQTIADKAIDVFKLDKCETTDDGTIDSAHWGVLINGNTAYSTFRIGAHANAEAAKSVMLGVSSAIRQKAFLSRKAFVNATAQVESTTYIVEVNNDKISFPDDITMPCKFYQDMADMPKDWETYNGLINQFKLQILPRYVDISTDSTINKSSYFIKDFLQAYGVNFSETINGTEVSSANNIKAFIENDNSGDHFYPVSMEDALNWILQGYPAFVYINEYAGITDATDTNGTIVQEKACFINQYMLLRASTTEDYIDATYVYDKNYIRAHLSPDAYDYMDVNSPLNQNRDRVKIPKAFFTNIDNQATFYIVKE